METKSEHDVDCYVHTVSKVEGNVLVLHRVKRSQIGSYLCIATNGYPPPRSARVELKVNCKFS